MFSTGRWCSSPSRVTASRARAQPAGRDRVLLGPGAGHRRAVATRARGSAARSRACSRTAFSAATHREAYRSAPRPWKPLVRQQRGPVGRHRLRRRDDRGVREDPARGHVALLGDLVAGLPQGAYGAQAAASADPVQAGGTAPRVDPREQLEAAQVRRTPAAPSRPCRPRAPRARASRSSTSTSTSRAAYSSHGLGQRPRRPVDGGVLLLHPVAEHVSTRVARPTRG